MLWLIAQQTMHLPPLIREPRYPISQSLHLPLMVVLVEIRPLPPVMIASFTELAWH
jgi:hypothetical protein